MRRRRARYERDLSRSWVEGVEAFEKRIGGVKLSALEDGDEQAIQTATRSLRKAFLKQMTAQGEREL